MSESDEVVEAVRERVRMADQWAKDTGYPPADYFDSMMDLRRMLAAWDRRADDAGRMREAILEEWAKPSYQRDMRRLRDMALAPEKKEAPSAPSHNPEIEIELMAAELVRTVRRAVEDANAEWPGSGGGIRSLALANAAVAAAVEWSELNKKFMNYVATKIKSIGGDVGIICGGDPIKSTPSAEPCVACTHSRGEHPCGDECNHEWPGDSQTFCACKRFVPAHPGEGGL